MGGKNPFLGWAYIATGILFVLLAVAGTVKHFLRPRRMGDMASELLFARLIWGIRFTDCLVCCCASVVVEPAEIGNPLPLALPDVPMFFHIELDCLFLRSLFIHLLSSSCWSLL
jgi:hypothetical protein